MAVLSQDWSESAQLVGTALTVQSLVCILRQLEEAHD